MLLPSLDAAQFCVDEICTRDWLAGRPLLSIRHQANASRFLPNPVWHFSDARRFRAFRRATELYERDLTNKLALEYRVFQGQKAGLARSIGFSVVENNCLRGVLEFSSENLRLWTTIILVRSPNVGISARPGIRSRPSARLDPGASRRNPRDAISNITGPSAGPRSNLGYRFKGLVGQGARQSTLPVKTPSPPHHRTLLGRREQDARTSR